MSLEIVITSENKGSNPGGRGFIAPNKAIDPHVSRRIYLKYCTVSHIHSSPLMAQHQPFYEAMFSEMAKIFGLAVPNYFVLLNSSTRDVSFSYSPESGEDPKKLHSTNKTFFVSQMVDHPIDQDTVLTSGLMESEKIYRDVLNLADISGKPNNYTLVVPREDNSYVLYIDLGCGLVDAHYGILSIRKGLSRRLEKFDDRDLKEISHRLKRANLMINRGAGYVNLAELGETIPRLCCINVLDAANPSRMRKVALDTLLSPQELAELRRLYFLTNQNFLSDHKGDPRIHISR